MSRVAAQAEGRRLPAMPQSDSQRLAQARQLLTPRPPRPESLAGVTAAAAFFALSALALATAVVMMPSPWPT